jgi:hypothetical protein
MTGSVPLPDDVLDDAGADVAALAEPVGVAAGDASCEGVAEDVGAAD